MKMMIKFYTWLIKYYLQSERNQNKLQLSLGKRNSLEG